MKNFKQHMNEELKTKEINKIHFPNPITAALKRIFTRKGKMDGNETDDIVQASPKTWKAASLKASQDSVYLGKTLGMAIIGIKGGDLGAIVSKDKRILDGHHRWAATIFNDPKTTITGIEAKLKIGDLVPVLRALGDVYGNKRRGAPTGGDINIFKATIDDALKCILTGKNMHPKFYNKAKAIKWLEDLGGREVLETRLKMIQKSTPPKGAPMRKDMPVIDADNAQHTKAADLLAKGNLDVRAPYAKIGKK